MCVCVFLTHPEYPIRWVLSRIESMYVRVIPEDLKICILDKRSNSESARFLECVNEASGCG